MISGGYQPKDQGNLGEPPNTSMHINKPKTNLKEVKSGYVSCVRCGAQSLSGESLYSVIEIEGQVDMSLAIDNDKAADWYGKRVKVTVEVDSE